MRQPKKWTPEWFRYIRFVHRLTMEQAGEIAGVSYVTWYGWESGRHSLRPARRVKLDAYLKRNAKSLRIQPVKLAG